MKSQFAVGAILMTEVGPEGNKEEIKVDLIVAETKEQALGMFFMEYLGKGIMIRDFSIRGDGVVHGFDEQVVEFCKKGMKINAIKRYRELSGEGLREAKDYIEQVVIPQLKQKGVISDEPAPEF
jgi:hypothetical protein